MEQADIPEKVWESALVVDGEAKYYRMDTVWSHISSMKSSDGTVRFARLAKVAHLVLILPHSNAQEERVFSMVTKNKTAFRPNLKLDGTLASILSVKLANPEPCHCFEPPQSVIDTAKKATMEYNQLHCSKTSMQ